MQLAKEFLNYAAQCRAMAEETRDAETRSMWRRMAERWDRMAAERQTAESQPRRTRAGACASPNHALVADDNTPPPRRGNGPVPRGIPS
jgi:hypothetical protein